MLMAQAPRGIAGHKGRVTQCDAMQLLSITRWPHLLGRVLQPQAQQSLQVGVWEWLAPLTLVANHHDLRAGYAGCDLTTSAGGMCIVNVSCHGSACDQPPPPPPHTQRPHTLTPTHLKKLLHAQARHHDLRVVTWRIGHHRSPQPPVCHPGRKLA